MSTNGRGKRPSPLSEHALRQLIRVAIDKGYYREFLHHPERNISVDDCLHGLERDGWKLVKVEWSEKCQNFRYEILTCDVESDELTLIVEAFASDKRIEFITAW